MTGIGGHHLPDADVAQMQAIANTEDRRSQVGEEPFHKVILIRHFDERLLFKFGNHGTNRRNQRLIGDPNIPANRVGR